MPESVNATRHALLDSLRAHLPQDSFATWFQKVSVIEWENGVLKIAANNNYVKQWIESHYRNDVLAVARSIQPETHAVEVVFLPNLPSARSERPQALDEVISGSIARRGERSASETLKTHPTFRLSSFVAGATNRLAYDACASATASPGALYNPLLIHADHGLGKTHLLQGLAHALHEQRVKVRLVSCEEFANAYLRALQERKLDAFRADYRSCQALVVDDIQFLAGKEKTQDEMLHTFDALRNLGRQIALSSDVHPREIKNLDPRLAERFVSGLVVRIPPPDFATRVDLIRSKADSRRLAVTPALAEIVAARVERSVRELEGVVCKIGALSATEGKAPDKEMVVLALRELGYLREGPLSLDEILAAVVQRTNQSADEVRGSKRHASLVRTRHMAMYLCKQLTSFSLGEIGIYFGNRDHSTVLHAVRKVTEDLKKDEQLRLEVQTVRRGLGH
ncbi:MAG: chromosomal replication initiator protein DnaA [Planctomycetota bacterium]|nr:chromosomal replication initiator protein DnaA [Planctomycetota bacterium]